MMGSMEKKNKVMPDELRDMKKAKTKKNKIIIDPDGEYGEGIESDYC